MFYPGFYHRASNDMFLELYIAEYIGIYFLVITNNALYRRCYE